jgi:hypothetical protein
MPESAMPKLMYVNGRLTCDRADMDRFLQAVAARGPKQAGHKKAKRRRAPATRATAPPDDYPLEWLSASERQRVLAHRHPQLPPTSMDPLAAKAGGIFA